MILKEITRYIPGDICIMLTALIFIFLVVLIAFCIRFFIDGCKVIAQKLKLFLMRFQFFNKAVKAMEEKKFAELFKTLPSPVKYERDPQGDGCTACAICIEDFKHGDLCLVLPSCKHIFHSDCIKPWLIKNQMCPNCRTRVSCKT